MKIATIISKLFLLALFLLPNTLLAQNKTITVNGTQIQISTTLQIVLGQVETVYGNPLGITMNEMYYKGPEILPTFLGLIMHRQKIMMMEIKNVEHLKNRSAFEEEIITFLDKLAQAHKYLNPWDNTSMPSSKLQVLYYEALNGNQNANFKNNVGLDPTTVNITYLFDRSLNKTTIANNGYNNATNTDNTITAIQPENNNVNTIEPANIELAEEEAPTEINLFGEVSPYAMGHAEVEQWQDMTGVSSVEGLVCPEKNQSPNTYFFSIDTNNIPNDGTEVQCVYFGKDGPLKEQKPYKNNYKLDGVNITYAMNGDVRYLSSKKNYVNGQKHGVQESYTVNDKGRHYLRSIENYVNDKKEGVSKSWNISKNGEIYLEWVSNYSNGKFNGNREFYSTTSETEQPYLFSQTAYVNGEKNGEEIEYRSDGRIESKEIYKNGKRNGECVYYSRSGKISFKCNYINDKEHGQCISYNPRDGITHCITTYENGVKIGEKCFDPKGNIVRR